MTRFQRKYISIIAIVAFVFQFVSPVLVAEAGQLSNFTDTVSSSAPSQSASHIIQFTSTSTLTSGQTLKVSFDPTTSLFDLTLLINSDIIVSGFTLVTFCGGGSDEMQVVVDNTFGDRNVTFTDRKSVV